MIALVRALISNNCYRSRFFLAGGLILFVSSLASAQAVGSTRGLTSGEGSNSIQGRVYFPAGESGKSVKVTLESGTDVGSSSTATDQDGVFRFNSLRPGNYTVVIEGGKDYENNREPITIDPLGGGRVAQVNIQLRPKIGSSNPAFAGVPQNALDFYQKGAAAAQKGDSKGAVEFLGKAVAASPTFPLALSDLGSQYMKLLQWNKAAQTFEALLKLKPDDATAHLDLGIAQYNLGIGLLKDNKTDEASQKLSAAELQLREALRLKSAGPSAHYYLGLILLRFKRYDESQTEMEAAIKNGGDSIAMAHRTLGGLYQMAKRSKEAGDELEKYLQLDPKAPDADRIKSTIKDLRKQ